MGCFFACFRIRDGRRSPLPSSATTPSKTTDRLVRRNQLAALLLSEEHGSACEAVVGEDTGARELKHEAKFLKACGVLLETPAEIRNKSKNFFFQTHEEDELLDTSSKKLQWDDQCDQISMSTTSTPSDNLSDNKHGKCMSLAEQTVISCINNVHSAMFELQSTGLNIGSESVCLKVTEDDSQHEYILDSASKCISPPRSGKQMPPHVSKDSPFTTPLKLTDGEETPGSLYPANMGNCGFIRHNQDQPQFAYPVRSHIMHASQLMGMSEDSHDSDESGELFKQQATHTDYADRRLELQHSPSCVSVGLGLSQSHRSPLTYSHFNSVVSVDTISRKAGSMPNVHCLDDPQSGDKQQTDSSPGSTTPMVASLSQWLKPSNLDGKNINGKSTSRERSSATKSPETDRPIIGMVAAHWTDEDASSISPKLWDGNGIPNSTNKYKEDQRVSWHATPFEERLEKALSDEKLYPQRKLLNGKPIEFEEESEDADTATSRAAA